MTAVAKGRTLYEAANKEWIGADPVPWEELGPDDKAQMASIEDAVRAPLKARLDELLGQVETIAVGLETSALSTFPGKKSEIEDGCATALRALLEGARRG